MADDQDANVLGKFENILNKFSEAVAQMSAVGKDKFASVENNVAKQGGAGNATWNAIGNWLPTAENKVENNQSQFNVANSGSKDAATGKERLSMLGSGLKDMGVGAFGAKTKDGKFAGLQSGAEQGQQIFQGIGNIMGAIGGPVGQVGMIFAKLAEKSIAVIDYMQKYSEELHKANMQFAEFSGSMAAVQAQQDVRDMQLSQERGERRSEAAGYLAEGKSELASATAPWGDMMSNIQSYVGGGIDRLLARLLTPLNFIAEKVGIISTKDDGEGGDQTFLESYFKDEYQKRYGRPIRFRGQ